MEQCLMKSTATNKTKKVRVIPGYHLTLGITVTMLSLIVLIPLASVMVSALKLRPAEFWSLITKPTVRHAFADEIYVICGYTDMRKSIDGLCAVVKDQLNMNPSRPNAIYLFCGRRSDRIKVLLHEREGFVLLYKRLDANVGKYRWPRNRNEVKPITWRQFDWLMSGLETEQPKAIKSTGNA